MPYETKELAVYNLVIAKGGSKLLDANSENLKFPATIPAGVTYLRSSMQMLLASISGRADRPVLDKTGLAGTYVYPWTNPGANGDPSIFAVLQDDLGLKLEPAREQVDMLAIERVEQPSEN